MTLTREVDRSAVSLERVKHLYKEDTLVLELSSGQRIEVDSGELHAIALLAQDYNAYTLAEAMAGRAKEAALDEVRNRLG